MNSSEEGGEVVAITYQAHGPKSYRLTVTARPGRYWQVGEREGWTPRGMLTITKDVEAPRRVKNGTIKEPFWALVLCMAADASQRALIIDQAIGTLRWTALAW